ncbi:MAG TPA: protein kinase [Candidatus Acidoferrales bacterium]|nr:protein kinase [Candidatus Acidoferrales bacterium]
MPDFGPYHAIGVLGEGGMGIVYLAEQREPIRRRVALKVLKRGDDRPSFIARFESERQALAVMDHPHIAHVYDAGATADGRPYLVMEYVPGIPITDYCDHNLLGFWERLALFQQVCQAVQHAPERDYPSRPEAQQCTGHPVGRQARPQGDRFRSGEGREPAADGEDTVHRDRHADRHSGIHESGAGRPSPAWTWMPRRTGFAAHAEKRAARYGWSRSTSTCSRISVAASLAHDGRASHAAVQRRYIEVGKIDGNGR